MFSTPIANVTWLCSVRMSLQTRCKPMEAVAHPPSTFVSGMFLVLFNVSQLVNPDVSQAVISIWLTVYGCRKPSDQCRPNKDEHEGDELKNNKGNHSPIDMGQIDSGRADALKVEDGPPDRRGEK